MRKRSWKYRIAWILLAALPILYLVEERVRGEWLLARYRKQLIARGEKLTIEELTPPVSKGTNVLILDPLEAEALLDVGGRLQGEFPGLAMPLVPGKAVVSWQRDQWFDDAMVRFGFVLKPGSGGKVYAWDDYLQAAGAARERLPKLREQITNQVIHINLDYLEAGALSPPHPDAFQNAGLALCQAAAYDLRNDDLDGALENLHASARLAAQLVSSPMTIDQSARVTIGAANIRAIWESLQAEDWTDAQLAVMQADWQRVSFTPDAINALRLTGAVLCDFFYPSGDHFSRTMVQDLVGPSQGLHDTGLGSWRSMGMPDFIVDPVEAVAPIIRWEAWRFVWAPFDERVLREYLQELRLFGTIDAFEQRRLALLTQIPGDHPLPAGKALRPRPPEDTTPSGLRQLVSATLMSDPHPFLNTPAMADACNQVMVTAIALKRFHLKHGRWPEDLAALVPEFLPEIPIDWMDGQPLRYRLRDDGTYLLYSIGADGIDQGGSPEFTNEHTKDWMSAEDFVWPQPATPEEVAAADAETAASAAALPPPQMDEQMMRQYGLLPPEPETPEPVAR